MTNKSGWKTKSKGNAKVHTHPDLGHAIYTNFKGVFYAGLEFKSVDEAKTYANVFHMGRKKEKLT